AVSGRFDHSTRRIGLEKLRIVLRPSGLFGFLLRIEMIEVAKEFVEAMIGRKVLVFVAKVVLPELSRRIAERLQRLRDGDIARLQSYGSPRRPDLAQSSAQACLPGDECRSSGRTTVLGVVVGEAETLISDTINVRRTVA